MKLLLLAFAIVSLLAQRTQGVWGKKRCFNNVGRCRDNCKSNEEEHYTCLNKLKCCVPLLKIPKESSDWSATGSTTGTAPPKAGALTTQPDAGGASAAAPPVAAPPLAVPPADAAAPAHSAAPADAHAATATTFASLSASGKTTATAPPKGEALTTQPGGSAAAAPPADAAPKWTPPPPPPPLS